MKKQIAKITLFSLVAAALVLTPTFSQAQDQTNAPAQTAPKKHKGLPFHGKVAAVDTTAQTLTVGSMTFTVTAKTKITNASTGEAATLADITVGVFVSGSYKKSADGLQATVIHIGKKASKKNSEGAASSSTGSAAAPAGQ